MVNRFSLSMELTRVSSLRPCNVITLEEANRTVSEGDANRVDRLVAVHLLEAQALVPGIA